MTCGRRHGATLRLVQIKDGDLMETACFEELHSSFVCNSKVANICIAKHPITLTMSSFNVFSRYSMVRDPFDFSWQMAFEHTTSVRQCADCINPSSLGATFHNMRSAIAPLYCSLSRRTIHKRTRKVYIFVQYLKRGELYSITYSKGLILTAQYHLPEATLSCRWTA